MEQEQIESVAFKIIMHSGEARTIIHEAFQEMKDGEFESSSNKLNQAKDALLLAHKAQTKLLQRYSSGEEIKIDIIMVHAQDHLMNTMTLRDIALEMLTLHKKTQKLIK
ncbi:PTS cellobiose transporter subunit IIA [Paraliobacillus salinarum]|uniref:PTS cellobiose transporter subunit IIA n=1 Tax=Paraliobacillus salinarum TaxID=1158996 RepID=UPI0015F3F93F|nr:PTS cellobiose transporter subunit IIA [Paraliobacillus salinarum]